ncbi:NADP-dependent oxidoreductase domain, partial [Dillenia turbinata]
VSKLGFGCMSLTGFFSPTLSDKEGISIIKHAFNNGITFFDTAEVYGSHANEILVGKVKRSSTGHFGLFKSVSHKAVAERTNPASHKVWYCRNRAYWYDSEGYSRICSSCCEASLKRLDVDCIDLYYQHRVDTSTPIEETVHKLKCQHNTLAHSLRSTFLWSMGELKKLVEEGKIKYIGLSEASPETIRRAHAVHPITAVQMEWSLWTRDIKEEIIPLCRELGIGIVPYSPLGRGFFGGKAIEESLAADSPLTSIPRFQKESLDKNKTLYTRVENLAKKHGYTPAQLALAWVLHQGEDVVPIPGISKIKNLEDNIGSMKVRLTEEELKEIADAVPINEVVGARTPEGIDNVTWKFANTPPAKGST